MRIGASVRHRFVSNRSIKYLGALGGLLHMSITRSLHRNFETRPEAISTRFHARLRNWRTTYQRVSRLAGGLVAHGLQPGDRLAILASNSDVMYELIHAVAWAGAVVVPLNTRWSAMELAYALADCDATMLAVDAAALGTGRDLCEARKNILLLGIDAGTTQLPDCTRLAEEGAGIADVRASDSSLCSIFYTGGTTGRSRGVMLSHGNHTYNSVALIGAAGLSEPMRYLHTAPMFHIADALFVFAATMVGAEQTFLPSFDAAAVTCAISLHGVTDTLLVPTMIGMLLEHQQSAQADLSSLRRLFYGGSPIAEATLLRLARMLPNCAPYQLYGQTESAPVLTMLPPEEHSIDRGKLRSAGRPLHGVDVRVVDANDKDCEPRVVGEIIARGLNVMQGYWNNPPASAASLREDWLRTGDAGYLDAEGFVFVTDRIKDMIISGGENIYSIEVENALAACPGVRQCAVIGLPDPLWGERVHAVVVYQGELPSEAQLTEECAMRLARYKVPRSFTFRTSPLPLSGAGKILKTALRREYADPSVA
jgi:long-chain acyl-CoA synthetase